MCLEPLYGFVGKSCTDDQSTTKQNTVLVGLLMETLSDTPINSSLQILWIFHAFCMNSEKFCIDLCIDKRQSTMDVYEQIKDIQCRRLVVEELLATTEPNKSPRLVKKKFIVTKGFEYKESVSCVGLFCSWFFIFSRITSPGWPCAQIQYLWNVAQTQQPTGRPLPVTLQIFCL